jgi:membrane fusion protein, epimerase transport system
MTDDRTRRPPAHRPSRLPLLRTSNRLAAFGIRGDLPKDSESGPTAGEPAKIEMGTEETAALRRGDRQTNGKAGSSADPDGRPRLHGADAGETADRHGTAPDPSVGAPFGARLTLAGLTIILFFCGSLTAWSLMAPVESAIVAPGIVRVDSSVRTVQHLEGGIVESINVREGDQVEAGQVLIRLQSTLRASERNEVLGQYFEARATQARLESERDGLDEVAIPTDLREKMLGDQALAAAIAGQVAVFENRRSLLDERLTILDRARTGLESEIEGLEGQIRSAERQLHFVEEELRDVNALYQQQLAVRSRVLTLERDKAELEGVISQSRAAIGSATQRLQASELRVSEMRAEMATEIVAELRETRARAYELSQRLTAAEDRMGRTDIRSPISGIVVGLEVHTVGGVIAAGQPLLDVVPVDDKLVIHAMVNPLDIDQVEVGLPAMVWLSAINRRTQSPLEGTVRTVSADRLVDPQSGQDYYLARVELDMEDVNRNAVPLQQGMSAEVMIRTGARTALDYLAAPISRGLTRAMREE